MSLPVVAVVGATGAVGVEFLALLEQRKFPMKELRLLASARSKGKTVTFKGTTLKVEEPAKRSGGIKVADVAELVAKLKNEAKVI